MTNTNIIIHNLICLVNKNKGSSLLLPAYGREGQGQHLFNWRRISQSEIRRKKINLFYPQNQQNYQTNIFCNYLQRMQPLSGLV